MRQFEHHEHEPLPAHERGIAIALADVRDPLNVGHAFRLGSSLGVEHIYLLGATPAPPNAKLNRTARGAQHQVPFTAMGLDNAWAGFRQNGRVVICVEYATASRDLREVSAAYAGRSCVLVVGNEAHGLPPRLLDDADVVAHLPMYGAISSYNVATALAIALWEWVR